MFGGKRSFLSGVLASLVLVLFFASSPGAQDDGQAPGHIKKNGIDVDIRSLGKQISVEHQISRLTVGGHVGCKHELAVALVSAAHLSVDLRGHLLQLARLAAHAGSDP